MEVSHDKFIFSIEDIFNIPIIKYTSYPIIKLNYSNLLKKNDVIIKINNLHISNMNIYNYKLRNYQTIDEYLIYISQFNSNCRLTLIRNKQIVQVELNIDIFKIKTHNNIYIDINDLYVKDDNIKFSTDIVDYMLENEIYNKDIIKFLDDFSYQISKLEIE